MMIDDQVGDYVLIEAKILANAMKIANAIVEPRVTIPILSTVRLGLNASGLTIEATDLDLQVSLRADEIDGHGEWQCCIPAKYLTDIAVAAGVTPLRIEPSVETISDTNGPRQVHRITIQAGDATYSLDGQDPEDFPQIMGDRLQRIETFTNGRLASMLDKISFCISTEETRYYLNGVSWQARAQGMRMAATDGHRLVMCRYADNENGAEFSYIIPRKTVMILTQFMANADVEIYAVGRDNQVSDHVLDLRASGISMRTKLIDGTYPDIDRVIPSEEKHRLAVRRDEMLAAIKQATAIGSSRFQAIRLHGAGGRLSVELKNIDMGTAKVTTSSDWPEGLTEFGVNSRYLAEMIKTCHGEIAFGMMEAGHPITLTDDDKDMTRVVMPMRV